MNDEPTKNDEVLQPSLFPEVLYNMLEAETAKEGPIRWAHDGAAFVVDQVQPDLNKTLKIYFSHGKYTSLQ